MAYFDFLLKYRNVAWLGGEYAVHHARCLKNEEAFHGSDGMALLCDIQH